MTTITIDRAVLEQAVEALDSAFEVLGAPWAISASTAIREAFNAPSNNAPVSTDAGQAQTMDAQPEPLQHKHEWIRTGAMQAGKYRCISCGVWNHENFETPQPVKREWVGLTYHEIINIAYDENTAVGPMTFASAIEQALKERNHV